MSGLDLLGRGVEVRYAGYVSMEERRKVILSLTV